MILAVRYCAVCRLCVSPHSGPFSCSLCVSLYMYV